MYGEDKSHEIDALQKACLLSKHYIQWCLLRKNKLLTLLEGDRNNFTYLFKVYITIDDQIFCQSKMQNSLKQLNSSVC